MPCSRAQREIHDQTVMTDVCDVCTSVVITLPTLLAAATPEHAASREPSWPWPSWLKRLKSSKVIRDKEGGDPAIYILLSQAAPLPHLVSNGFTRDGTSSTVGPCLETNYPIKLPTALAKIPLERQWSGSRRSIRILVPIPVPWPHIGGHLTVSHWWRWWLGRTWAPRAP